MLYICANFHEIILNAGFSLTPYLESFTPTFGLGTPVFPRISSNLHCGTPTFSTTCLWDSYFQNPSENPVERYQSYRADTISIRKITKGNNSTKNVGGVTVVNLCTLSGHALYFYQVS